jgi:hypothetical protein
LYDRLDAPITTGDCGALCMQHNPGGGPFCCDLHHAVPAVYHEEWAHLRVVTSMWRPWEAVSTGALLGDLPEPAPEGMRLLACQGAQRCQRSFRALSCRQFPFFPFVTSDGRLIGMAYSWDFEPVCWVINHLEAVTEAYRSAFISVFDELFSLWPEEMDSYAALSEEMRIHFATQKRRIPILHRAGGFFLLSPASERLRRVPPDRLPRFGPYRDPQNP